MQRAPHTSYPKLFDGFEKYLHSFFRVEPSREKKSDGSP
jgi:hypothetical protein